MNDFKVFILFFIMIADSCATPVEGDGVDSGLQLSSKWFQGPTLLYDCVHNHYVCSGDRGVEKCRLDIARDMNSPGKKKEVRCTVIKTFKTQKECIKKQYELIGKARPMPFCLKKLNN